MMEYFKLQLMSPFTLAAAISEAFPKELGHLSYEEIGYRLGDLQCCHTTKKPVPLAVRLTLPLALMALLILALTLPFAFMVTGRWGYRSVWLSNWFRALGGH